MYVKEMFTQVSNTHSHRSINMSVRHFKKFTHNSTLHTQQGIHMKEMLHKCNICRKRFNLVSNLHARERINKKEQPNECDVFQKRFTRNAALHAYQRIHTKEKSYKCDICQKCLLRFKIFVHIKEFIQ